MTCTLEISWPTPVLAASQFAGPDTTHRNGRTRNGWLRTRIVFSPFWTPRYETSKWSFLESRCATSVFHLAECIRIQSSGGSFMSRKIPCGCGTIRINKCMYDMIFFVQKVKYIADHTCITNTEDSRGSLHLCLRLVDTTSYLRLSVGKIQKVQYRAYYRMLSPFRRGCMPHLHPSVNFWQATFFRYEKLCHDKTKDERLIRHALKRCKLYFPTCTTIFTVSIFAYVSLCALPHVGHVQNILR